MKKAITIPEKEYNYETGKMEDTNLPHWQEYYRKMEAFNEMMEAKKPKEPNHLDYKYQNEFKEWLWKTDAHQNRYGDDYDAYNLAMSQWEMARSMDAPNKPGYLRANND